MSDNNTEVAAVATPKTHTIPSAALKRIQNAHGIAQAVEQEAKRAHAVVQDLLAVAFLMVDAPQEATFDLDHGTITWPASPAKVDANGVSVAVPSAPVEGPTQ